MGWEEDNTCFRGCCRSQTIPLHLPSSSYILSAPIARGNISLQFFLHISLCSIFLFIDVKIFHVIGAESIVYEATLNGQRVAVKKPILSTSQDIDRFHKELQLLWSVLNFILFTYFHLCFYGHIVLCMYTLY